MEEIDWKGIFEVQEREISSLLAEVEEAQLDLKEWIALAANLKKIKEMLCDSSVRIQEALSFLTTGSGTEDTVAEGAGAEGTGSVTGDIHTGDIAETEATRDVLPEPITPDSLKVHQETIDFQERIDSVKKVHSQNEKRISELQAKLERTKGMKETLLASVSSMTSALRQAKQHVGNAIEDINPLLDILDFN